MELSSDWFNTTHLTSLNGTSEENIHEQNIVSAVIFSLIILPGLFMYFPVLWTMLRTRKDFDQPFYTLVYSLAVGDICICGLYGQLYIVPSLLSGRALGGKTVGTAVAIAESVAFVAVAGSTFIMSLSRLCAIVFPVLGKPMLNTRIFGPAVINRWVIGIWVHAGAVVAELILLGCQLEIAPTLLNPMYTCNSTTSSIANAVTSGYITTMISIVLIAINLATFGVLIGRQRMQPARSQEEKRSFKMEARFFVQSFAVYLGLLLNNGLFQLVTNLNLFSYQMSVALGAFMFLNSTMSPAIFIAFNKKLRKAMLSGIGVKIYAAGATDTATEMSTRHNASVRASITPSIRIGGQPVADN